MSLDELKEMWIEAGYNLADLKLNFYKIDNNLEGYITSYYAVLESDPYDFYGQMSLFPEATEGWYKFIPDESECGGYFYLDQEKKDEIIAKREEEAKKPTQQDLMEAQLTWTALITDTLLRRVNYNGTFQNV